MITLQEPIGRQKEKNLLFKKLKGYTKRGIIKGT
jgi:hypothetical protein